MQIIVEVPALEGSWPRHPTTSQVQNGSEVPLGVQSGHDSSDSRSAADSDCSFWPPYGQLAAKLNERAQSPYKRWPMLWIMHVLILLFAHLLNICVSVMALMLLEVEPAK